MAKIVTIRQRIAIHASSVKQKRLLSFAIDAPMTVSLFHIIILYSLYTHTGTITACLHPVLSICARPCLNFSMASSTSSPSISVDDPFLYCEDCMNVAHRGRKRC